MRSVLGLAVIVLLVGALAHAQDNDLISAAASGDLSTVNALVKSGVDVNTHKTHLPVRPGAQEGETALYLASENGHVDVVRALLAAGADVNAQYDGRTPLVQAAEKNYLEVVKALLAAKADPPKVILLGRTVLLRAINMNHLEIARALVEGGASVATSGVTPLMAAAGKSGPGTLELVQTILAAHADVNTRFDGAEPGGRGQPVKDMTLDGTTPLGAAVSTGSLDIVQALLAPALYADVNAKQRAGNTPLIIAAAKGRADVVRLLLAAKADVNGRNDGGETAMMLAVRNNHSDVAEILRSVGAAQK